MEVEHSWREVKDQMRVSQFILVHAILDERSGSRSQAIPAAITSKLQASLHNETVHADSRVNPLLATAAFRAIPYAAWCLFPDRG